jgi:transposase-like protein
VRGSVRPTRAEGMAIAMRYPESAETTEAAAPVTVPSNCPTCRSSEVTTVSKVVTAATYWRCGACGDVWNAGRRREVTGYSRAGAGMGRR